MNKQKRRTWGWVLSIAGTVIAWKPALFLIRLLGDFGKSMPLTRHIGRGLSFIGAISRVKLILGLLLIVIGILLIILNREKRPYWRTNNKFRIKHAVKKVQAETDWNTLDLITGGPGGALLMEVRQAADDRRIELLYQQLESGDNLDAVRSEIRRIINRGMYNSRYTDFLAASAKKRPEIIRDFWPDLQKWAHQDSNSHTDTKPGFHNDETAYYDYFRYPDGRSVANKNGRQRHTDTRSSYSDCHDDSHADSTSHTDTPNDEKITRFKPYIPE